MATLAPSRSRNLVITRAGSESLHAEWFKSAEPDFDLLVTAYSQDAPIADGEFRIFVPGPKVAGYAETFRRHPEIFDRYEYIALIDNDISADAAAINASFSTGRVEGLKLWQPSLTIDSYFTYAMTLRNPLFRLRFTDFVEMMCPFFEASALCSALPLFEMGFETGIDLAWVSPEMIRNQQAAVLDAVSVRHTRPVGVTKLEQGFDESEGYDVQVNAFLKSVGIPYFSYPRILGGLLRGNVRVAAGPLMTVAHAVQLRGLIGSPETPKHLLRALYHLAGFGIGAQYHNRAKTN